MIKKILSSSDWIILIILWGISINSLIAVSIHSYNLVVQCYLGYMLLLIITFLRYFKVRRFKTFLGIFLLMGTINVLQFTYSQVNLVVSWQPVGHNFSSIGIQPISAMLLIFFGIINFAAIYDKFTDFFSDDYQGQQNRMERSALRHYETLKDKDSSYLQSIIDTKEKHQIESVRAARKILNERQSL